MLPIASMPEYATIAAGISGYEFNAYDLNTGVLSGIWSAPQRA